MSRNLLRRSVGWLLLLAMLFSLLTACAGNGPEASEETSQTKSSDTSVDSSATEATGATTTSNTTLKKEMPTTTTKKKETTTTTTKKKETTTTAQNPDRPQSIRPGLYLEGGVVKLNGEKFYGIGTNYYDLATRQFYDPMAPNFEKGVKTVKEYGIPVLRVRFSAWGTEGMNFFWNDRETYWRVMDQAVRLCEKYEIGIIAVLAWTTNPYIAQGETAGHFLSNRGSEGYQKMLTYMEAVVTRYRNSPAIWGWEVGNEYNLSTDLDVANGTNYGLTADILADFYKDVTPRIAKWDGYGRIINHGHSQNRHAAWNLYHNNNWNNDTAEQTAEMLKIYDTPQMSVTSIHVYQQKQNFAGQTVSISEYLSKLVAICKGMGKPLYVGEYCDDTVNGITGADWTAAVEKAALARFETLHNAIMENDIQLAFIWSQNNDKDVYRDPSTYVQGMLKHAKSANAELVKAGKQKTESYWKQTHDVFYAG